jgi:DNA-binding response OmpR family regulator
MNGNPEHISLVESDPDIRELIVRQALRLLGYQVQVADDVRAAIFHTQSVVSIEWRPNPR